MAAAIAWCLIGAVMVGAVLMYGCMHRFITQAYEEGRQDSLTQAPTPPAANRHQELTMDETPATSPQPPTKSAA